MEGWAVQKENSRLTSQWRECNKGTISFADKSLVQNHLQNNVIEYLSLIKKIVRV
jgi:hypothetical protein